MAKFESSSNIPAEIKLDKENRILPLITNLFKKNREFENRKKNKFSSKIRYFPASSWFRNICNNLENILQHITQTRGIRTVIFLTPLHKFKIEIKDDCITHVDFFL